MINFEISILINCPITDVFEYVSDTENDPRWNSEVVGVERIDDCDDELSCKYRIQRVIGKKRVENIYRVTEYTKNKILTIKTLTGPTPFTYRYSFEPIGTSTRILLNGKVKDDGLPFKAHAFFAAHMIKLGATNNFQTLKSILESKR
ncbi:MAG: SRPBCC family protein [Candidatus Thorarchaeota archaeon]